MPSYDVIVIGGGPAGLSAALVLARARRRVLVCDAGRPRNAASQAVHGFLTRDGTPPGDLLRLARDEVAAYGVEICTTTVIDADCGDEQVEVTLDDGQVLSSRKLLLATGVSDVLPDIPNIREFYGISVHHCPYCDGWEVRDKAIAAYGKASDAIGLAESLLSWSRDVVVCIDGGNPPGRKERNRLDEMHLPLRREKIVRLEGTGGRLERIIFAEGEPLERRAMFFNTGQVQRSPLADKLGCLFDRKGHVITDRRGRTRVCDVFLAGDASGDVQFVISAASDGAKAAVAINRELQEQDRAGL